MRGRLNILLGYIQSEMVKGRMTAVQAETLTKMVRGLETEAGAINVVHEALGPVAQEVIDMARVALQREDGSGL